MLFRSVAQEEPNAQPDAAHVENNVAENVAEDDNDVAHVVHGQNNNVEEDSNDLHISPVSAAVNAMDSQVEGDQAGPSTLPDNHMDLFKELVNNIASSVNSVLPALNECTVTNIEYRVIDVDSASELKRKCYVQINTVADNDFVAPSTVKITEIQDAGQVSTRAKKSKVPTTVAEVRRSDRLAKLNAGFKGKAPINSSDVSAEPKMGKNKKKKTVAANLGPMFEAQVIDEKADSPPHLPIPTLQAIGTGPCQMHPMDVSEETLNYDSSYDSIE